MVWIGQVRDVFKLGNILVFLLDYYSKFNIILILLPVAWEE